ncbi:MAG: trypsin-like peptidase domain-containing protein [Sandaracinaceae bacterium]|nr:trypsin-like peptidase domain-containing protein [Sandaracinaceae bacterium]
MIDTRSLRAAACVMFLLAAGPAHAQELSQSVTRRAVRAAVKITVEAPGSRPDRPRTSTGSGSIIDPRGYILTNFHVVGNTTPGAGAPGSLFSATNEVRIAMVDTAREAATVRYIGRVVRADVRLDLALIRIVSDVHGNPLPASTRFSAIQLADTTHLRPGTRLYAFGFPLGVHTINVTSGEMSGFQMNSRDQVAWIRTDAEFNPGNSGGMLLDRQGRLVAVPTAVMSGRGTLEPIELARPVERVPSEWRRDLRRGHLEDTVIEGIPELAMGDTAHEAVGDSSTFDRPEMHYFRLPTQRPLRIEVSPALTIGLLAENGFVVREGQGEISIQASDPQNMVLGMMIPARQESGGGTLAIRIRTRAGRTGPPGWDDMPPPRPSNPTGPANP